MTDDQRAEELKNQGNEEFKQGRYTQAVDLYSQAIGNHTSLLIYHSPHQERSYFD